MNRAFCAVVLVGVVTEAAAQNMAETALAAATGSVAGVAGKPISDAVDKIFGKVNAQAKSPGVEEEIRESPAGQRQPAAKTVARARRPAQGPAQGASSSRPYRGRLRGRMHFVAQPPVEPQPVAPEAPAPQAPRPSREDISSVFAGAGRAEVVARLGAPVAQLSMPASGELIEIYQYIDRQGNLGSVRFRDGRVTEVRLSGPVN